MTLLSPWGLAALALAIPVIALHILRPRREEHVVASTLLWKDVERPVSAASPWQRLRPSLLLFLQLLAVALLALSLADPAKASAVGLSRHTVFIVDTSASMGAASGGEDRIDAARARVLQLLGDLPDGGLASVVAVGQPSEVLVSGSADRGTIRSAMARLKPTETHGDFATAFTLAQSLETPGEDVGYVLVSDGGLSDGEKALIPTGTRYEVVGRDGPNVGIVSLTAEPRGGGLVAHVAVRNYGTGPAVVGVRVDVDGRTGAREHVRVTAGDLRNVDVQVPAGTKVEAYIEGDDLLDYDNYAIALAARQRTVNVRLEGVESPALKAVFTTLPDVKATYQNTIDNGSGADLVVYNEVDPPSSLAVPALAIAAPNGVPGAAVVGAVTNPAVTLVQTDDPLLDGVDLADTAIGTAQKLNVTAAEVLVSGEGAPLLVRSHIGGHEVIDLAFRLPDSNLYVQVAFPVLMDRVVGQLARSGATPPRVTVGAALPVDTAGGGTLVRPDGKKVTVEAGASLAPTDQVGLWRFVPTAGPTRSVAVNADPAESDVAPVADIPIPERTKKFGESVPPALRSIRAWFLWALIAVIALEWLVARRRHGVTRKQWRIATTLRIGAVVALALTLLQFSPPRSSGKVATMFLIDGSASVGAGGRSQALDWLASALEHQNGKTLAGVALFGGDARLESTIRQSLKLDSLTTKIDSEHTNIAGALRLAAAVLPEDAKRRVVLLSDGRQNTGDVTAEAGRLADRGIAVDVVGLGRDGGADAAVSAVQTPAKAAVGESVPVTVTVDSTADLAATVELRRDTELVESKQVRLVKGANRVEFGAVVPPGVATMKLTARVLANGDQVAENDSGYGSVQITAPSRVLVLEGEPGNAVTLVKALRSGGLEVDAVAATAMPTGDALGPYRSIVLNDVAVTDLSEEQIAALTTATRDEGRGLVTIGGTHSYALGGYRKSPLEDLLPVVSDVLDPKRRTTVAEVLAVDTSGSMGACHCGANGNGLNSAGGGTGMFEGGANKTSISRAAAQRSLEALSAEDQFGVVGFDNTASWIADLQNVGANRAALNGAVTSLTHTSDGTDIAPALPAAAASLKKAKAGLKHIILFTDGFTSDQNLREVANQAKALRAEGMTVSVMSTGETTAVKELEAIATAGGGRFYPGTDLRRIPQIMAAETVIASRNFVNEGTFFPEVTSSARVVAGLTSSPALLGYVATTAKPTATTLLRIGKEHDPLLASWQNGLGRATSWTSDASARWSKRWASWTGYVDMWANVVKDTFPADDGSTTTTARVVGDDLRISVDSTTAFADGASATARVSGPGLDGVEVPLERTSGGSFTGSVPAVLAGTYRVGAAVSGSGGKGSVVATTTADRFYSPEFKPGVPNTTVMAEVARLTKGRVNPAPASAFSPTGLKDGRSPRALVGPLLALAAVLWFLAIVLSRLSLGRTVGAQVSGAAAAVTRTGRKVWGSRPDTPERADRSAAGESVRPASSDKGQGRSAPESGAPDAAPRRSEGTVGSLLDAKRRSRDQE